MIQTVLNYLYSYLLPIVFAVLFIHLWKKKDNGAFLWLAVALGIVPLWLTFHRIIQSWYVRSYIPVATVAVVPIAPAPASPSPETLLIFTFSYIMLNVLEFGCLVMALRQFGIRCLNAGDILNDGDRQPAEGERS